MAVSKGYLEFVVEQLERVTPVVHRAMFGGVGLYAGGRFFALVDDDRLYFKVDDSNRPDYARAGSEAFRPFGDERSMSYFELPADVLEDVDQLGTWMAKSINAAAKSPSRAGKKSSPALSRRRRRGESPPR